MAEFEIVFLALVGVSRYIIGSCGCFHRDFSFCGWQISGFVTGCIALLMPSISLDVQVLIFFRFSDRFDHCLESLRKKLSDRIR